MTVRWRVWWLTGFLALAMGALWLRHCSSDDVVATLDAVQGGVERDYAAEVGRYAPAAPGSRFRVGDAVKTAHAASATLTLDEGSRLALQEDTLLRFMTTPPGGRARGMNVETGHATLETSQTPLDLYTSVGLARLEAGTRVDIEPSGSGLRFAVRVGLARFETLDGPREIASGQQISIDIGGAILESAPSAALPPREPPPASDALTALEAQVVGAVQVRDPDSSVWRTLPPGSARLRPGSALQIAAGARVSLASPGGSVVLKGKGEFIVAAPGAPFVQARTGRIVVERGATPTSLSVPGGSITVRPWSKAQASVDSTLTQLGVSLGGLDLTGKFGSESLLAGESATLTSAGHLEVTGRGPAQADMVAVAGTSFVVHDPSPPTSVRFQLKAVCPEGGQVERIAAGSRVLSRSRGDESANILLALGTHRYQVRCVAGDGMAPKPSASGTVTILRDTGTGVLSRVAPMTLIDADGRSYTVMYQNLLPEIVVRWPKAPRAESYTLTLDSKSGTATSQLKEPTRTFKAGQINEGNYKLTFSANGRSSPPTKLVIAFDNAAPAARIQSPDNGSFQLGSAVSVAGVAVPGWGISVEGRELVMDAQSRFSEQVTASLAQQALQLRFSHPRRGVHYYLRHAAEAPL